MGDKIPPDFKDRLPVVIGHRGSAGTHPENTLVSFLHADHIGTDFLEFDVRLTKDGHVVIMHDDTVDRTTDGTGRVRDFTLAEIKKLDAGYRFTPDGGLTYPYRGKGITVPTLDEFLDACPDARLMIELKEKDRALVSQVFDEIFARNRQDQIIFGSFDYWTKRRAQKYIRKQGAEIPAVASKPEAMATAVSYKTGAPLLFRNFMAVAVPVEPDGSPLLSPHFNRFAHDKGLLVAAWTVNDAAVMKKLFENDVDVIVTDFPARALPLAAKRRQEKQAKPTI